MAVSHSSSGRLLPSGGSGGGIAYNREELETIVEHGLDLSPVSEVLIEESLLGWKEFEMEVMRDRSDNCVVVCSIENFDPMGVHTGDSITVAPAQTLSDREYQAMRDASFAVIREIGVETGGSNIQFAVNPDNGRMIVIEMNPRVSRSSALASKATGFPIAKIAAKLAVGYTLDEIPNDITRETPACFEPTIDYCVVKVPRFTFEKFPEADATLTTRMKSVGEAMAIGRTFKEALQKALRSLEIKRFGLCGDGRETRVDTETLRRRLSVPNAERIFYLAQAFEDGMSMDEIFGLTKIDRWFLQNIAQVVAEQRKLGVPPDFCLRRAKKLGFSDRQLTHSLGGKRRKNPGKTQSRLGHPDLPAGRYLRGGIRGIHSLLLLNLRERKRDPHQYETQDHDPRRRPESHRPGYRVRLLLRPRRFRSARARDRNDHGQLQPGNGFDRLRHERQTLLRATHPRGRPQHLRAGNAGGRDRAVRRADAAESRRSV